MKIKAILTSFLTLLCLCAVAQNKLFYTASGDAIEKGIKAHDKEDYKSALKYYNKVHPGDTNYHLAQYEKAMTYFMMEEYEATIEIAEKEIGDINYVTNSFYNVLGNAYDESEQKEKAIEVYTEGISKFPTFYRLYYNRALTLERLDKPQEAIADLKLALQYNPYHAPSHLKLANYAKEEGEVSKAMMAFNAFLLLASSKESETLSEFNDYLAEQYDNDPIDITLSSDDYSDIDELLASGATQSKKYKTPNKLSLPMVKQNYLLMTELQKRTLTDGFWDVFYVPFYIQIMENDKFNDLMYYELRSATNNSIVSVLNKNIKSISAFPDYGGPLWQSTHSNRKEMYDGKVQDIRYYWSGISAMEGRGVVVDNEPTGIFEYYYSTGRIQAIGHYDMDGERNGSWTYYFQNGNISGKEIYADGDIVGMDTSFYKNGYVKSASVYEDGQANGKETNYSTFGVLQSELNYKMGVLTGVAKYYNEVGTLEYDLNYLEGNISGEFVRYHDNGQIAEKVNFDLGKRHGEGMRYYANGQKSGQYNYAHGDLDGKLTKWFEDGTLKSEGEYKEGVMVNTQKDYYPNGKLESESIYDENGKKTGRYSEYDKEGNLNLQLDYKKGDLIAYTVFAIDGSIIKEAKKKGGNFLFENFYSDGTQKAIGSYVPGDKGKDGVWKFYNYNGALNSESSYSSGQQYGQSIVYYASGKKKETTTYKHNEANGLYVEYYENGNVSEQGYFVDDVQEGLWVSYYSNGTILSESFFVKGELNGPLKNYTVNGKLDLIDYYDYNTHIGYDVFDTNEVRFQSVTISGDSNRYTVKDATGKIKREFHVTGSKSHGESVNYYPNGQVLAKGNYFNDFKDGDWAWYFEDGQLEQKGTYLNHYKEGKWEYYHENGVLKLVENYQNGTITGLKTWYRENGKKEVQYTLVNSVLHGPTTYYDGNGVVQHIRTYAHGKFVGYSYLGTDGSPVATIPVINETCDCVSYFSNGKKSREFSVVKDSFTGLYTDYYENGQIHSQKTFEKNQYQGDHIVYYDNGQIMKVSPKVDDIIEGLVKSFNKDGSLKKTETYVQGEKHGPTVYYKAGKPVRTLLYYDSDLISQ